MKTTFSKSFFIIVTLIFAFHLGYAQFGAPKYEKIIIDKASVEFNCDKSQVKILNSSKYTGGGLFVVEAAGKKVYYECMGTVCQSRCNYTDKPSDFKGDGETNGNYHKLVMDRAAVEFDCKSADIKQVKHTDSRGQGYYVLSVCGKEVEYECAGSVCNLKCK